MAHRDAARKSVEDTAKGNGHIPPAVLETMTALLPKESLGSVLEAMGSLKRQSAASVKTLAQNLDSSSAEFIFELLQNYDDSYTGSSGPPNVTFRIYPDRIVASCHEAGFAKENVESICSIGQSLKPKQAQTQQEDHAGYTGKKGIGFKSVFMVAEEVHIQSGDYSFRFVCKMGDSGLGMTTPIWTDHDEALDVGLSHIVLTLRQDGWPSDIKRRQEIIHEQFHNIHDSILLFMKRLERIDVSFYDKEDLVTSSTVFTVDRQANRTTTKRIKTTWDSSRKDTTTEAVQYYAMVKHTVKDLAPSEDRRDADGDVDGDEPYPATSDSVVVLGFPMDANCFLIRADFVTQASREDIITTSKRNEGLATGIAEAFVKAVLGFCESDMLQYTWMRYLPRETEYPVDVFWRSIIKDIHKRLQEAPVIRPAGPTQPLVPLSACRLIPHRMRDRGMVPLLPDTAPECYPSSKYCIRDLDVLRDVGLKEMTLDEWLLRLENAVSAPTSIFMTPHDSDWYNQVDKLLMQEPEKVKQARLIPLRDGRCVAAASGPVYYSWTWGTGLKFPQDLDLAVVDAKAAVNPMQKRLFDRLGVRSACVDGARQATLRRYKLPFTVQRDQNVVHLRFLYLTHHLAAPPYGYDQLYVWPQKGFMIKCGSKDVYMPDDGPYGVTQLLCPSKAEDEAAYRALGFDSIPIMHEEYFANNAEFPTQRNLAWRLWLHKFLGIRQHLRLADSTGNATTICKYVAEHHPEKFVQLLRVAWSYDSGTPTEEKRFVEELGNVQVLCRGGRTECLRSTYFPLQPWVILADSFLNTEFYPWLELEPDLPSGQMQLQKWTSLCAAFGLGYDIPTQSFLINVLRWIKKGYKTACDVEDPARILRLYACLQSEIKRSKIPKEAADDVRYVIFMT
ncbi:hypothetical protein SCUCBS95973_000013 [Sporothrix curviconia]|uniref:Uncharacterized protein n=1 Tax=Sporothrix curviconia TaxID=1260050 RepID=A0ABP0AK37_9PEZI